MQGAATGFLSFDDLAASQGELAISMEYDSSTEKAHIEACAQLPDTPKTADVAAAYLTLCNFESPTLDSFFHPQNLDTPSPKPTRTDPTNRTSTYTILDARTPLAIFAGKKYKPVALKIRPVETELPSRFRILRNIKGDPMKDIPTIPTQPPAYVPTGRYTAQRKEVIDQVHPGDFLLPEEHILMHHFMCLQHEGFAWTDQERGHFWEDFFPPIEIPTIPHKPWTQHNIPIPPGIYEEVCELIKRKLKAGVYEASNLSQ
jgi:hypothetical protein